MKASEKTYFERICNALVRSMGGQKGASDERQINLSILCMSIMKYK